jgi:tetratricopeptide (TPR) repeat protein
MQGKVSESQNRLKPLLRNERHVSRPLFLLTDATINYTLGNYKDGLNIFLDATQQLERELSTGATVSDLARGGSNTNYRGFPHERILARYYTGVGFMQTQNYQNAVIAFRQALEIDTDNREFRDQSYIIIHFLLGESYLRLNDYENARVSFRAIVELNDEFAPGWYKLAFANKKLRLNDIAETAYERYSKLVNDNQRLPLEDASYIFIISHLGFGPYMLPDRLTGITSTYNRTNYPETRLVASINNNVKESTLATNIYDEASNERRLMGEVTRGAATTVARVAASQVPGVGLFVRAPQADLRKWLILPGEIHILLIPADIGIHDVNFKFKNSNNVELRHYEQTHYYLPSNLEGSNQIIFLRSIFNKQNQR